MSRILKLIILIVFYDYEYNGRIEHVQYAL